jgi:hypothetical protein
MGLPSDFHEIVNFFVKLPFLNDYVLALGACGILAA